jgi:hypothetical protein
VHHPQKFRARLDGAITTIREPSYSMGRSVNDPECTNPCSRRVSLRQGMSPGPSTHCFRISYNGLMTSFPRAVRPVRTGDHAEIKTPCLGSTFNQPPARLPPKTAHALEQLESCQHPWLAKLADRLPAQNSKPAPYGHRYMTQRYYRDSAWC